MTRGQHRRLRKSIDVWVDDEVHGTSSVTVAAHLRECWDCSSMAETTLLVKRSLRRLGEARPPPLAAARLRRLASELAAM